MPDLRTAYAFEIIFHAPARKLFEGLYEEVERETERPGADSRGEAQHGPGGKEQDAEVFPLGPVRPAAIRNPADEGERVLAIDPTTRGFGFVVFEGSESPIDWGAVQVRGNKKALSLRRVEILLDRYQPDVVVAEDASAATSRRCARVRDLLRDVVRLAASRKVKTAILSRTMVLKAFSESGASTRHQIAAAIAARFPELAPRLPPPRRPWMSEDERMSIFDAAALGLTFFALGSAPPRVPIARGASPRSGDSPGQPIETEGEHESDRG